MSDLRFRVLGPVRAWRGEEELDLGSPQARLTLAVLLLAGGRVVGRERLIDAIWGDDPPPTALGALRTYVSRLRSRLGDGVITSAGDGYAVPAPRLDLDEFTRLCEAEQHAEALRLWQGQALGGLAGGYAQAQRDRLEELRLSAVERAAEQAIEQRRGGEAVGELSTLCAAHPLREHARGLLMRALAASGRKAEALAVYTDTRRLLAAELGVDPSAELAALHRRMLADDTPVPAPAAKLLRPAQLPADIGDFTGRAAEVGELTAVVRPGRTVVVSAIAGIGGVGKTRLAVRAAHLVRREFPDGQLYVDLMGMHARPLDPAHVLGSFLRALGVADVPEEASERAALYRSALAERRVLVLLDNAADVRQVKALLPGSPGCAVIVTSRARLVALESAHRLDLDVLDPGEALTLLARIAGEERVAAERAAAMDVVAACGFLPLAVRIAGSRLAGRPGWTVARLRDRLADERRRLAELRVGELAVEATFSLGFDQLTAEQARALRLLAVPDAPDLSAETAGAVLDVGEQAAEELCEALVDLSLLESPAPRRYRYHDLLRTFARGRAGEEEARQARRRLLDFHLASAAAALRVLWPGYLVNDHLAPTRASGLPLATPEQARSWATGELPGLLGATAGAEDVAQAVDLLLVLAILLDLTVYGPEVAAALSALPPTPRCRYLLGYAYWYLGRADDCATEMTAAMADGEDDVVVRVGTRQGLAIMLRRRGEGAEAAGHLRALIQERLELGDGLGVAWDQVNLGMVLLDLGEPAQALQEADRSIALVRELGHLPTLGHALIVRGTALHRLGDRAEAGTALRESVELAAADGVHLMQAMAMTRLAEVELAGGHALEALVQAEAAVAMVPVHDADDRRADMLTVLGRALVLAGQPERGRACLEQALAVFDRLGRPEADQVRRYLVTGAPAG